MRTTPNAQIKLLQSGVLAVFVGTLSFSGCGNPGARARLTRENMTLREDNARLERRVQQLSGEIESLHKQIDTLQGFDAGRPVDLFAPVQIDIVSLSGGADFDGRPGDDGVIVYVRPRDSMGDPVKAPGRIRIQVTDHAQMGSPRVLGVYVFDGPDDLRNAWHRRFGTMHYSLRCPFVGNARPQGRRCTVHVEFVDFLTGRTLTAVKELAVNFDGESGSGKAADATP